MDQAEVGPRRALEYLLCEHFLVLNELAMYKMTTRRRHAVVVDVGSNVRDWAA